MSGFYLEVDTRELDRLIENLREVLSDDAINRILYRTMKDTGAHAPKAIWTITSKHYEAPKAFVNAGIEKPKIAWGAGASCTIPLNGARGTVGGTYSAHGGKRSISLKVVKGKTGKLPDKMDHQGGNPPFFVGSMGRTMKSGKKSGLVFTRTTDNRLPIARVAALSVPQLPLAERERDEVINDLGEFAMKRLEHYIDLALK